MHVPGAPRLKPWLNQINRWPRGPIYCVPSLFLPNFAASATLARGVGMVQRVATVAFEGVEARGVDVQVQVAAGMPAFHIVGLADKAVSEAGERVGWARTAP